MGSEAFSEAVEHRGLKLTEETAQPSFVAGDSSMLFIFFDPVQVRFRYAWEDAGGGSILGGNVTQ